MCDLIDLDNSTCSTLNTKLASPLLPVPSNIRQSSLNVSNSKSKLIVDKHETILGNNPFDTILDEAIKNVNEQEDPFEIVSKEALRKDVIVMLEDKSVNTTDDFKATYSSQKLEEGQTFDESSPDSYFIKPTNEMSSLNLSILSQSAMNDTLYETNCDIEEDKISCMALQEIPLCTQQIESDMKKISIDAKSVPLRYMRSHSSDDILHQFCKQYVKHRINSAIETSKIQKMSTSDTDSLSSAGFNNFMDQGFTEDQYGNKSVFSTSSNISNDTKLTYNSLTYNSGSPMIVSCDIDLNERINNTMNIVSVNCKPSSPIMPVQTQIDISALMDKLNAVNTKIQKEQVSQIENTESDVLSKQILSNTISPCKSTSGKTTFYNDDKVLDINTCLPEITFSKSCSTDSFDSIFVENNKAIKSVLDEAKVLARTFEELARRVSGSSLDEFILNDFTWTSELLPAFEDEEVNDLINLPSSPNVNKHSIHASGEESTHDISTHKSDTKNNSNNIRQEIVKSPLSPITADKKIVSTLLLDLKKIVKAENNSEAEILFENLEKVLGIQSRRKIELSMYNKKSNDPQESHENYNSKSDNVRNNDAKIHKIESNEDKCRNDKMNNEMEKEVLNDSKKLVGIENKVDNDLSSMSKDTKTSLTEEKSSTRIEKEKEESNEKAAVELLINIGKVLSAQTEESTTLNLLKNLGEVLHVISQNKQKKSNEQNDVSPVNSKRSMVADKSKTGRKVRSLNVKTPEGNIFRRSLLVPRSPNKTLESTSVLKHNSRSQLKETKKRFSSDSNLTNPASYINKIGINSEVAKKRKSITRKDIHQVNIEINNQEEKPSIKLVAKNQLKSKIKPEIINKKGPMKAIIPIGNMQRKGIITSPKSSRNTSSIKMNNSMSNLLVNGSALKKSAKSKNLISSTPNTPKCKSLLQMPTFQRCDRLNVSCDISPINLEEEVSTAAKHRVYLSPRRTSQNAEISQVSNKKEGNFYKRSPVICKKVGTSQLKSPLKDSNKITKAKPLNLTAKLRRSNNGTSECDKENFV